MGASNYSAAFTTDYLSSHARAGTDAFVHTAKIASGAVAAGVHDKLNPAKANKAGKIIRESFDSDAHPNSLAIAVLFDVTGSMQGTPRTFIEKLPKLMSMLVKKGYVEHPHILFGAVGDATCDDSPLQLGQFEAGNEMDEALSLIHLEGGGGGQVMESYELAAYFMARHTDMDCLNKRGKKGFLFFIGDELPYRVVERSQVKAVIGDTIEANIRFSALDPRPLHDPASGDIIAELQEKFEVFWIMPGGTAHFGQKEVVEPLKEIFGQNHIKLENPADICELIATTIGVCEGYDIDKVTADLNDVGADKNAIMAASTALAKFASSKSVTKGAVASGELVTSGSDNVARL